MKKEHFFSARYIAHAGVTAAVYVAVTAVLAPISFGAVQMRLAEMLNLLAFFSPVYAVGVTIGCLFSNMLFSEFGIYDIIIGTISTGFAVFFVSKCRNLFLASLMPVIFTLPVSAMISALLNLPFLFTALTVALGEFIVVTAIGVPIFRYVLSGSRVFLKRKGVSYGDAQLPEM